MTEKTCGGCRHWHWYDNGRVHTRVGLCKRMPPTAVPFERAHPDDDRHHRGRAFWPVLLEQEICGEFSPKRKET